MTHLAYIVCLAIVAPLLTLALARILRVGKVVWFASRSGLRHRECPECGLPLGWQFVRSLLLRELLSPLFWGPGIADPNMIEPLICRECNLPISVWPKICVAEWAVKLPPVQHATFGELQYSMTHWETSAPIGLGEGFITSCLLYTSPSPRDKRQSRMPSSA